MMQIFEKIQDTSVRQSKAQSFQAIKKELKSFSLSTKCVIGSIEITDDK